MTFEAIREERFYVFSHPHALRAVENRAEDIDLVRNPTDPFAERPEVREKIVGELRG
jgi:hypothetical protein